MYAYGAYSISVLCFLLLTALLKMFVVNASTLFLRILLFLFLFFSCMLKSIERPKNKAQKSAHFVRVLHSIVQRTYATKMLTKP